MPTVVFIRHGETNYNKEGRFTGQEEAHLTEKGINDAKNLGMKNDFDYFYRSPLVRTKETLDAIFPGTEAIVDDRIIEVKLGDWQGKVKDKLDQDLVKKFRKGIYAPKGAESRQDVIKRAKSFLDDLFKKYKKEDRILVVTHAGVIKALQSIIDIDFSERVSNLGTLTIDDEIYNNYLKK